MDWCSNEAQAKMDLDQLFGLISNSTKTHTMQNQILNVKVNFLVKFEIKSKSSLLNGPGMVKRSRTGPGAYKNPVERTVQWLIQPFSGSGTVSDV